MKYELTSEIQVENLINRFRNIFNSEPSFGVAAPGRVNIIGEHTDYNDGFVLPAAIDKVILMLVKFRDDTLVRMYSETFKEEVTFDLRLIEHDSDHSWSNYERGVADVLQKKGYSLRGVNIVLAGNIPVGSGLSSSAAVEVATAAVFRKVCELDISDRELALISQQAENEFVGMKCGIMDQFASCLSRKNNALFLDCRSLDFEYIPLAMEDLVIVLCNTNVPRQLVASEYNKRRSECEEGVKIIGRNEPQVNALRDVDSEMLDFYEKMLPPVVARRCRHVVEENKRVSQCVAEFKDGNMEGAGTLLNQSHESLRDLYEVSCKELDVMAEIAWSVPGVLGARMMGGGFGGCTINLVRENAVEELRSEVQHRYTAKMGYTSEMYICHTTDGVNTFQIT